MPTCESSVVRQGSILLVGVLEHGDRGDRPSFALALTRCHWIHVESREAKCCFLPGARHEDRLAPKLMLPEAFRAPLCGLPRRMGADWFESYLVDYDVASNWGPATACREPSTEGSSWSRSRSVPNISSKLPNTRCQRRKLGSCSGHDDWTHQPIQCLSEATFGVAGGCWVRRCWHLLVTLCLNSMLAAEVIRQSKTYDKDTRLMVRNRPWLWYSCSFWLCCVL